MGHVDAGDWKSLSYAISNNQNDVFVYDNTWTVVVKRLITAINLISCHVVTSYEIVRRLYVECSLVYCDTDAHERIWHTNISRT